MKRLGYLLLTIYFVIKVDLHDFVQTKCDSKSENGKTHEMIELELFMSLLKHSFSQ